MFSTKIRRKIINSFLSQLFKKVFFLIFLGMGLAFLGGFLGKREFISRDILEISYKKLIDRTIKFNKFFLGNNLAERKKLLNFALIFIMIIIITNILATLINIFYRLRDKYIKDNEFYLYNRLIYFLYLLSRLISYIVITLCLCSFQTLLWMVIFISFYSWFWAKKGSNHPKTKNFFLWRDPNVRKILLYLSLIILILPIFYSKFQKLFSVNHQEFQGGDISELQKILKNLFTAIPGLQIIIDLLANISSFAHWIILLFFARSVVFGSIKKFNDFWNDVEKISSKFNDFRTFYYYQKIIGGANLKIDNENKIDVSNKTEKVIVLGDFGFLALVPNFLKHKGSLRKKEDLKNFTEDILKVIENINFIQNRLNPNGENNYRQKEVNFIIFKIFTDSDQSLAKIEETKKLISF